MQLSPSDFIYVGDGRLYGPPFLCNRLLYRLRDCDRSDLIHHDSTVRSTHKKEHGIDTYVTRVTVCEPTAIYVHVGMSAETTPENLLRLPRTQVNVPGSARLDQSLGALSLTLDPCRMPSNRLVAAIPNANVNEMYRVGDSKYSVRGPARLKKILMNKLPEMSNGLRVWKVSLRNEKENMDYTIDSERDWSLSAFAYGNEKAGSQPRTELAMERD